jgi:DUF4097 and DUF4098 domain-containing protein YvlB
VQYPKRSNGTEPTLLKLQVPLRASLDVDSVSADIDIDGVASQQLGIETVSGNVVAAAAPRRADIDSVSGDLQLTLNSDDVRVVTVSGDAVLKGRLGGEVHGETVSGKLSIDSLGGRLRRLTSGTVSGDTVLAVGLAEGGEIRSETVSGDVLLRMPAVLSARVSGESFSGDLGAPNAKIHTEEFGPGKTMEASYGSGAGEIRLESFSGDAILVLE